MPLLLDEHHAKEIDDAAERLFRETFHQRRKSPSLPYPVEWAFKDLQLTVGWVEMATMLPAVQSLAFLCVPHRAVLVDESLHPNEAPELRSRLRFTFAHEIGHWCLHRRELDVAMGWSRRDPTREVVREQEANRFAGALLIPATMLRESWRHVFGIQPIRRENLLPVRSQLIRDEVFRRRFRPIGEDAAENLMFEGAVSGIAANFGVSPQALRIRAEELGLIVR